MPVVFPVKGTGGTSSYSAGNQLAAADLNAGFKAVNAIAPSGRGSIITADAANSPIDLPFTVSDGYVLTSEPSNVGNASGIKWAPITLSTNALLTAPTEQWNIVTGTGATGSIDFNVKVSGVYYYTTAATANWTINFQGSSTVTLNSILSVGQSITVVFLNTNDATHTYYPSTIKIDTATVTPVWQGGTAPTAGNVSSTDVYTFNIVKTSSTPTYKVFASLVKFA